MIVEVLLWPEDRIEHIARHNVSPQEVEEVCFGRSWVLRARAEGVNPVYHVLGQTAADRYLLCIVIAFPDRNGYPITARSMTAKERRRYHHWQRK